MTRSVLTLEQSQMANSEFINACGTLREINVFSSKIFNEISALSMNEPRYLRKKCR